MKKSYIKIILFIFIFSFVLLLNSLKFKMLGQIELDILLLVSLWIVYLLHLGQNFLNSLYIQRFIKIVVKVLML